MIDSAELPAVRQVNRDHLARFYARRDQPQSDVFDQFSVLRVGNAAVAGAVNDRGLVRHARARFEYDVVNKASMRIGVETSAQHADVILARSCEVFHV